ncbi:guanylate kinase [bacterium]|nr:guanylate kinase [bacterium]
MDSDRNLFVLSSPSAGGKTTIIKELMNKGLDLSYSISATTRPPREGEKEGVDYFFFNDEVFQKKIREKAFIEWANVHGYFYGTLCDQVNSYVKENKRVLFDLDVHGGINLKKAYPQAVLIFLLPPSMDILKKRLIDRGTETEESIEKRFKDAMKEIEMADAYDFQIINDRLEDTIKELVAIIQ